MSQELELLKKDLYVKEFCEKHNLSDALIENNKAKIVRVLKSRSICENCSGLSCCKQKSIGERLSLTYDDVLFDEIELCDYAVKKLKKDNLVKSYVYCDVPENLIDLDLKTINYTKEQETLYALLYKIFLNESNNGLYISGEFGVGKTYLCVALANSLVKDGKKVAFVKVSNFFNEMKSFIVSRNEMIDININKLQKTEYLFLDDIGSEAVSEFVRDDILFRILDYRMENKLTTIFTSNLNKSDLLKHYTYDRKDNANLMNANRLMERIEILAEDYVLVGKNMRRQ